MEKVMVLKKKDLEIKTKLIWDLKGVCGEMNWGSKADSIERLWYRTLALEV